MRSGEASGPEMDGLEPPGVVAAGVPHPPGGPGRTRSGHDGRSPSARLGALLGALVVIVGASATALAAHDRAQNDAAAARRSFGAASAEVASTLQLAIERETDLVADTSAVLLGQPDLSNAAFGQWTGAAQVTGRYPELQSMGELVIVPQAALPAYRARVLAHPVGALGPSGVFAVSPAGVRPFYCLVGVVKAWNPSLVLPEGFDVCAVAAFQAVALGARDSGEGAYVPYQVGKQTWLAVETPIYRGGQAPAGVAARRAAFAGWVGTVINPTVMLDQALQGHVGDAVTLRYHVGPSDVSFTAGTAPSAAQSVAVDLRNGWTVTTRGATSKDGVLGDGVARDWLLAGLVLSLSLGALIYVLATGRVRALRMVSDKTDQLRYQALHDGLTGLPNRALILDRVEQALARARRQKSSLAVMFLDVDGFKSVNDTFGHAAGDQLLRGVAARLGALVRDSDTVGRLGGDEFVVVVEGDSLDAGPEVVAERIREVLSQPFVLSAADELSVRAEVSIGIVVGVRASAEDVLRDADVALYEAKSAGKNRYMVFAPEMGAVIRQRLELEMDLRAAVGSDQFVLAYQPIFDLGSDTITGVEALIRWQHPIRGLVMPDDFIPLAEETALIIPIGRWVVTEACRQAAEWDRRGHHLGISVNVSARQLDEDVDFLTDVRRALVQSGLEPGLLTLEITETMLMRDAAASARRLLALKDLGVRIAIDDFGTGYSSLGYIQQFPVDALKIDRSFMSGVSRNPESVALIHTMIQLGKSLGIETLAEGIEDRSQLLSLVREECDSGQGFLLARPLTPGALEELINATPRASEVRLVTSTVAAAAGLAGPDLQR